MRKWRSLTALRAFEAVARLGSVSAAASELNVTRPAISKQIAFLEQDLGLVLFHRTGNRIQVTEGGQELFTGLRQAFDQISVTTENVARRAGQAQRVRLLVCRDFAASWLGAHVGVFLAENPGISVEITAERNGTFRLDEDFDLRIFYGHHGQHQNGSLTERTLCSWIDMPVCALTFAKRYLQPGQLVAAAPQLIDSNYDVWDEWCQHTGFDPGGPRQQKTLFNETTLGISVAVSGGGLAIGDSLLALPLIRMGELIVPFAIGLVSAQTYSLFSSPGAQRTKAARLFETWLHAAVSAYQSTVQDQLALRGIRVVERASPA